MDFKRTYKLQIIGKQGALHVHPRSLDDIEDDVALYEGRVTLQAPLAFEFMKGASGSTPYDFVSTSLPPLKLVSERVVAVLRDFTGWATYPVEVYGKKGELVAGYHGLAVTGRCGPIDDSRSRPAIRPPAVPHGQATRMWIGLYFDPVSWDGSDVFLPKGNGRTFITEDLKSALERAGITNVYFTALSEAENMSTALLFGDTQ